MIIPGLQCNKCYDVMEVIVLQYDKPYNMVMVIFVTFYEKRSNVIRAMM